MDSTKPCHLLELPRELRNYIYETLTVSHVIHDPEPNVGSSDDHGPIAVLSDSMIFKVLLVILRRDHGSFDTIP